MASFSIETETLLDNIILLKLKGFLDAHTYEELEVKMNDYFDNDIYRLIFDLSQLDYISSAGAGVFIGGIGTSQENDGNIVLLAPKPGVKEVFDLLGLSQIFAFADDIPTAIKAFSLS